MDLASYFFKTDRHRDLLRFLFTENREYCAYELASLTGLPYATVHSELQRLNDAGMLSVEKQSKAVMYRSALT